MVCQNRRQDQSDERKDAVDDDEDFGPVADMVSRDVQEVRHSVLDS